MAPAWREGGDPPHRRCESTALRVLYLQPCTRLGGAERRAVTAIAGLPRSGVDVVPVVGPTPLLCRWLEAGGVRGTIVARSFPPASSAGSGPRLAALRVQLRCLRRLAAQVESIVRDGAIDLIVAGAPAAWVAAGPAARRLGVPVVWRDDGSTEGALPAAALRLWATVFPPDLILYDSAAARAAAGLFPAVPSLVLPAGVDLERFGGQSGEPRGGRPAGGGVVIGFAGRLAPAARPGDFVRLAARLAARRPDLSFLMAGEGPSRAGCEELARRLGVERALRFAGFVGDIASFYAACDIVVHPSYATGGGATLLEAMAAGRPVVAAEGPATAEVLTPGREGILCPAGDVEAQAEVVHTLVGSSALRRALGEAARRRVERDFAAAPATARLAAILAETAAARTPPAAASVSFSSNLSALGTTP
jgi:glycosyltransferase involved in cell wall biosynthesis